MLQFCCSGTGNNTTAKRTLLPTADWLLCGPLTGSPPAALKARGLYGQSIAEANGAGGDEANDNNNSSSCGSVGRCWWLISRAREQLTDLLLMLLPIHSLTDLFSAEAAASARQPNQCDTVALCGRQQPLLTHCNSRCRTVIDFHSQAMMLFFSERIWKREERERERESFPSFCPSLSELIIEWFEIEHFVRFFGLVPFAISAQWHCSGVLLWRKWLLQLHWLKIQSAVHWWTVHLQSYCDIDMDIVSMKLVGKRRQEGRVYYCKLLLLVHCAESVSECTRNDLFPCSS